MTVAPLLFAKGPFPPDPAALACQLGVEGEGWGEMWAPKWGCLPVYLLLSARVCVEKSQSKGLRGKVNQQGPQCGVWGGEGSGWRWKRVWGKNKYK